MIRREDRRTLVSTLSAELKSYIVGTTLGSTYLKRKLISSKGNCVSKSEWTVVKRLTPGDFGEVAIVQRDDVQGVIKSANTNNQSSVERLKLEVDALTSLSHVAIPRVIEDGSGEPEPYFVMTLATGSSALDVINEWRALGRVHGSLETLIIIEQLLRALIHIQDHELVHRDIKDANVIIDHSTMTATLIDFGFAKRAGTTELRDKDSFWRAGAARFSPPEKLEDSAMAVMSHDVFALGVLAYRLLTGTYPWSVTQADGLRAYKNRVNTAPLVMLHEVNSLIPVRLSHLVSRMLHLSDHDRISTREAQEASVALLTEMRQGSEASVALHRTQTYPHVLRDSLRGDIRVTDHEYRVINSNEVQRLRWIRQLGLANLVYTGADHSRLSHSIGTLERAELMLSTIEQIQGNRIDSELREEVRLYALVHDVSHIAFGHTIEDQLGFFDRHDANQLRYERLVAASTSELGSILDENEVGRRVKLRLNPESQERDDAVEHFISGPMGADVLDYLDRDALHCGLDHRVDSAVFRQLRLYEKGDVADRKMVTSREGKYGVRVDQAYAVESLLEERYAMFLKVYTHSAKIAADAVLGKALAAMAGTRGLRETDFESVGDEGLLIMLSRSRSNVAKHMSSRLARRKLPRGVYRGRVIEQSDELDRHGHRDMQAWMSDLGLSSLRERQRVEQRIAKDAGVDVERVFLYVPPKAPGFKLASHWIQNSMANRPSFSSPFNTTAVGRKHLALWEMWVFLADGSNDEKARVSAIAENLLQRQNIIEDYRQTLL